MSSMSQRETTSPNMGSSPVLDPTNRKRGISDQTPNKLDNVFWRGSFPKVN